MFNSSAQNTFFIIALVVFSVLSFVTFLPFLQPIVWAVVFSVLFYPIYKKINTKICSESASAFLTIVLFIFSFALPLFLIVFFSAKQAGVVYQNLQSIPDAAVQLKNNETIQTLAIYAQNNVTQITKTFAQFVGDFSAKILKATSSFVIGFFIMLYVMYYFLKDGKKLLNWIKRMLPTKDEYEQMVFDRFYEIIHSIFKGTFAIAFIQATMGALALLLTGASNVFLLFMIMFVLAVIPAIGPALVLILFAILFFVQGSLYSAIFILAVAVAISVLDNLLRPILVGRGAKLHDLTVALSIFGGLSMWGLSGFIVGPAIVAVAISLWELYAKMFTNS